MPRQRQLLLTPELVARAHRVIEDAGPPPDLVRSSEADWAADVQEILLAKPDGQDVWIFAYGSLLWNPAVEYIEERAAVAHGWHRSFCIRMRTWRGTLEQPGLMMGLDRGGQCKGLVYRLAADSVEAQLGSLVRRELPMRPANRPPTHSPRWVTVNTTEGAFRALAYVVNRQGPNYAGGLTPEETAEIVATACGHGGSCAEYLYSTLSQLEALGIRDRNLWRLQKLVAQKITSIWHNANTAA
jgi:glutathione-specific gamma-glutamylcyclotransferase